MEDNSSNALLMAGGVLLGVLIITLAVFAFKSSANFALEYEQTLEANQLAAFNNKFDIYNGREDITIYDIVSLANHARRINDENQVSSQNKRNLYIEVKIDNKDLNKNKNPDNQATEQKVQIELINLIQEETKSITSETPKLNYYKCKEIHYNESTGRVDKIVFVKVK